MSSGQAPSRRASAPRKDSAEPVAQLRKESFQDASLVIAQGLWGRGNLSPLDTPFGALALVKLIPTGGFGFIGRHLGQRLRKYADDTGAIIDAAEVDSSLTRLYAKPKSSVRAAEWDQDTAMFKPKRHTAFMVFQASLLCSPLDKIYGKGATSLKAGGKLISADLMETSPGSSAGASSRCRADCENLILTCLDAHTQALKACGLKVEAKFDLTADLLAGVRNGLCLSMKMLEEIRASKEEGAPQRVAAFGVQLETWRTLYTLAEAHKIEAVALLAARSQ